MNSSLEPRNKRVESRINTDSTDYTDFFLSSVKSLNPCIAFETQIRRIAQIARIFLNKYQMRLGGIPASVKSFKPCRVVEPQVRRITPKTRIVLFGQLEKMQDSVLSVKSKGWEPRIKKITRMTQTMRLNNEASEPFRRKIKSVKSLNPCKSVIQTMEAMGIVWN